MSDRQREVERQQLLAEGASEGTVDYFLDTFGYQEARRGLQDDKRAAAIAESEKDVVAPAADVVLSAAALSQMTQEQRENWDFQQALTASLEQAAPAAVAPREHATEAELLAWERARLLASDTMRQPRNVSLEEKLKSYIGGDEMYDALAKLVDGEIKDWYVINVPGDGWCSIYASMVGAHIYQIIDRVGPRSGRAQQIINDFITDFMGYYEGHGDRLQPANLRRKAERFLLDAFKNYYDARLGKIQELERQMARAGNTLLKAFRTNTQLLARAPSREEMEEDRNALKKYIYEDLTNQKIIDAMKDHTTTISGRGDDVIGVIDNNPNPPAVGADGCCFSWNTIIQKLQDPNLEDTPAELFKYFPYGLMEFGAFNILQLGWQPGTALGLLRSINLFRSDSPGLNLKDNIEELEGHTIIILTDGRHSVTVYCNDNEKQKNLIRKLLRQPNLWSNMPLPNNALAEDIKRQLDVDDAANNAEARVRAGSTASGKQRAGPSPAVPPSPAPSSSSAPAGEDDGAGVAPPGARDRHAARRPAAAAALAAEAPRRQPKPVAQPQQPPAVGRQSSEEQLDAAIAASLADQQTPRPAVAVALPPPTTHNILTRGTLGILCGLGQTLDEALAGDRDKSHASKIWVTGVMKGGVADNAGLKKGHEVTGVSSAAMGEFKIDTIPLRGDALLDEVKALFRKAQTVPPFAIEAQSHPNPDHSGGRKTKRIKHKKRNHKKTKQTKRNHKKTKHKNTKHKKTKHKDTKHKQTKHKNTKHKKTKHKKTKY